MKQKSKAGCYLKVIWGDAKEALQMTGIFALALGGLALYLGFWIWLGMYIGKFSDRWGVFVMIFGVLILPFLGLIIGCYVDSVKKRCQ